MKKYSKKGDRNKLLKNNSGNFHSRLLNTMTPIKLTMSCDCVHLPIHPAVGILNKYADCTAGKQVNNSFYLKGARRRWRRVNWVERIKPLSNNTTLIIVYYEPEIGRGSKSYSRLIDTCSVSLAQPRWMGFLLGKFLSQVKLHGG